jgi:hypothetical protein
LFWCPLAVFYAKSKTVCDTLLCEESFFAKTRAFTANLSWSQRRTVVLLMGVGKSALIAADDQVEWLTASRRMTLSSLEVVTLGRPER